jgi:hypothetical protein
MMATGNSDRDIPAEPPAWLNTFFQDLNATLEEHRAQLRAVGQRSHEQDKSIAQTVQSQSQIVEELAQLRASAHRSLSYTAVDREVSDASQDQGVKKQEPLTRYNGLASALLVTSTFAGTITLTVVFQPPGDSGALDPSVPLYCGVSSALFLCSSILYVGIFILVEAADKLALAKSDDNPALRRTIQATFVAASVAELVGFFVLVVAIFHVQKSAFITGIVLLGVSSAVVAGTYLTVANTKISKKRIHH